MSHVVLLLRVRAQLDYLAASEGVVLVSDAKVVPASADQEARRLATREVLQDVVSLATVRRLGRPALAGRQIVVAAAAVQNVRPLAAIDAIVPATPTEDLWTDHAGYDVVLWSAFDDGWRVRLSREAPPSGTASTAAAKSNPIFRLICLPPAS